MQILFLTARLPYPPDRGDRSRAFHFMQHLSREHSLSLASFIAGESEREHLDALRPLVQEVRVVKMSQRRSAVAVAGNLWRPDPLQALYYRSGAMQQVVDDMLDSRRFDLVLVHLFRMAPYVARRAGLYRVVDLTDAISKEIKRSLPYRGLPWRLIYRLEGPRIQRYERWTARTFEETWMISEADRQVLAADCPGANIQVVPIGVDGERFYPTGQPARPQTLIFVGHMSVFHNVDAVTHLVQDLLPLVRQRVPDCTLEIVGAQPSDQVRRLAAVPGVTVSGIVPDLNERLNSAAVFVAPLRFAAGIQTKILEAMAAARPVVTTSLVNDGLGAEAGREIIVADDAETAAEQIVGLLQDEERRRQLGQAGRAFVQRRYTWQHVVRRMRDIETELAVGSQLSAISSQQPAVSHQPSAS
jgi:sugar transferase (PEP-CTERM/EpsH1 system associated)